MRSWRRGLLRSLSVGSDDNVSVIEARSNKISYAREIDGYQRLGG